MSQKPVLNSIHDKTTGLKPALAAALSSLEVQLDQELARYRRTRNGSKTLRRSQPQLTGISTVSGVIEPITAIKQAEPEIKTNTHKAFPHTDRHIPTPEPKQETTGKQEAITPQQTSTPPSQAKTPTTPAPDANIVPAVVKNGKSENLSESDKTHPEPDGYLESSEALLLSLAEEKPSTQRQTNNSDSLLSPLGIGSMLLLLLASLTLGYVLFNPKSLSFISLDWLFKGTPTAANTEDGPSNIKTVPVPQLTPIPKYPNLAKNEFPEVKDADDVVGLKPKPKPSSVASSNPVTPKLPQPSPVASSTVTPKLPKSPPSVKNTPTALPSQKPAVAQQKPDAEIQPSKDGFYHIVIDNQGEAFASARKVIPDAYESTDGKLIFLGALKSKQQAYQQLEELQAQGIKARIQQP